MFAAKSAAPCTDLVSLRHPVLEQAAEDGITLLIAPAGYLFTESLAAALAERNRRSLWLRLGPEDCDPAVFLVSIIEAAQWLSPEVGADMFRWMRRQPGPTAGWPPLFAHLGKELAEALPTSGAVVLEDTHHLNDTHSTLELFSKYLLPSLPTGVTCTLTARNNVHRDGLPGSTLRRTVSDLRIDDSMALSFADNADAGLSVPCVLKAVALTEGRAVALAGLNEASAVLGPKIIDQAVKRAKSGRELLARVARAWLVTVDGDNLEALALAMRLGYTHPALTKTAVGCETRSQGPWLQPLADDWSRLRPAWSRPLREALRAGAIPERDSQLLAADFLWAEGALERAVPLYLDLGETAKAVQAITQSLDALMNLGQWETLGQWLSRLPTDAIRASPWLVYVGGEIAVAHGDVGDAQRAFGLATALFHARRDLEGVCQSMLAESALAAWRGERVHAYTRALAATALAEANGLAWLQGWAGWQLGCLAAADGKLDDALAYFGRAVERTEADDSLLIELLQLAEDLMLRQRELCTEREFHRNAYFAAERAEREVAERVRRLLSSSPEGLGSLLETHGWLRTPLVLKLPLAGPPDQDTDSGSRSGLWSAMLGAVGLRRRRPASTEVLLGPANHEPPTGLDSSLSLSIATSAKGAGAGLPPTGSTDPTGAKGGELMSGIALPLALGKALPFASFTGRVPIAQSPSDAKRASGSTLTAHLLGHLRVMINDRPVESWPSGRGRSLFKYLLTASGEPRPREVLMDLFWPNADPEAARNNLNVAIHGLRQALRSAADVPVVLYQDGAYCLNPTLEEWIDVQEFERHVDGARRLESTGDLTAAAAEYELAVGLYQGDFLADDPYEEWPVLIRERLRLAYLDTLDRLSQIYLGQGQYSSCGTLCQLILARDPCREDAHCRLMRCYGRRRQHHLAMRQYQVCVDALRSELDIDPAPATSELYDRIRRRELV
jgi:DNA-binding SARP family transcriptional activator